MVHQVLQSVMESVSTSVYTVFKTTREQNYEIQVNISKIQLFIHVTDDNILFFVIQLFI